MNEQAPIPAATLVLVRDRPDGAPQLLMVERAEGMAFAGGATVFPGGRIDPSDRALADRQALDSAKVAAVRETLEETAIPAGLQPAPDAPTAAAIQKALLSGEDFGVLLDRHGLKLDLETLVPFARWVPKFHARRRFDTLFFLAHAPPGDWKPNVIEGECASAAWVSAESVLKRDREGAAKLIFPTRRTLERLALHPDFESMLADARAHGVEPITPWVEESDGERFVVIPEGIGYPVTRERLDGLWRG